MSAQYITVREAAQLLGVTEKKIMDFLSAGKLQGYKIANQFLRLKKDEILALKTSGKVTAEITHLKYTPIEKIQDFFYFNDFYIITLLIIGVLIMYIFVL